MPRWILSKVLMVGVGYCLCALLLDWLSNIGLYRGLGVTPWAPASGLAISFAYIFGKAALPFILAGEVLIQIVTNSARLGVAWATFLVVASTAILMSAGLALRRLPDFDPRLGTVPALLNLIAVAVCQAVLSSTVYAAALLGSGLIDGNLLQPISWRLVVGHLVGVLIVAPLPLMLHAGWRMPRFTPTRIAQIVLLLAVVWIVFTSRVATTYQLFYLLFLPVLWVAVRDGIGGASLILNLAQLFIIAGAQLRADIVPGTGSLQILMIALAFTGLLVGTVVTDRQAAGQRLRDQHAALSRALRLRSAGETAAAISHQINQPITAISTYAMVARDALNANDLELARSTLDRLTTECDRAAAVARSIRDLVKQGSLVSSTFRLGELVEGQRRIHSSECVANDIALAIEIPASLPDITGDRIQLEQAIDNLVTNSIESIREAGRGSLIKISARAQNGDTFIEVTDDGPGFAPGLDALATTPFVTTKRNGSGLGLAIARSVAEAHGGSLAIVHRSTGACVRLRLPTSGKKHAEGDQHH